MDKLGIYIHIPFCIKKCNYCDFCSYPGSDTARMEAYTKELCLRIEQFADGLEQKRTVDTVYFGGGTPSLLPTECFERLMDTLRVRFDIEDGAEITAECNPVTIDKKGFGELRRIGINRISLGMQSANDNELKALGRLHSFRELKKAFEDARAAGFDNISVDLMYGIPEQTVESFEKTLREVCTLAPEHVSAYGLKIEDGTAFAACRDRLALPDEDAEFEMYCRCCGILGESGYRRYEISNFAKDGYASRHNLRYWSLRDYVGFGVAAYSCFEGERYGNSRDIKAFLDGEDITEERYTVTPRERVNEYVMLGLRLEEGIDTAVYRKLTGREFKAEHPQVDGYVDAGFLWEQDGRIGFTTKGFFVSNSILSEMLDFE